MNVAQIADLVRRGARITFEQYLRDVLAPAHMRGTWSQRWLGTLGAFVELIWQGGQEAADVANPATTPDDALDAVGATYNIERLIDEPDGAYRDRLINPFGTWTASATEEGIASQLEGYGLANVAVYDLAAGWDPGDSNTWSFGRLWIVGEAPASWGTVVAGDDVIAADDLYAGAMGMTDTDARNIRRIVHKWRAEHAFPVSLYLLVGGATLGATTTAAADALVASDDAIHVPLTAPHAGDHIYASEDTIAGWYIEPI